VIRTLSGGSLKVGGIHLHRPGPPPGHDLLRHPLEQAFWQANRLDPIQFDDLGQQRVQLQRPRILLQLLQERAPVTGSLSLAVFVLGAGLGVTALLAGAFCRRAGLAFAGLTLLRPARLRIVLFIGVWVVGDDQLLQLLDRLGVQPVQSCLGEVLLEHRLRRAQEPFDPARRRRFEPLLPAPRQHRCP
jgi:hypothetical protein